MPETIDLRSDTVTQPSTQMRQAMAQAEVGDDVLGEDPTVIRLQEQSARLLGKEEALFVPSGTMANQISLLVHCRPGEEVILGWGSHCNNFEGGAGAAWAGVQFQVLGTDGFFTAEEVDRAINADNVHLAPSALVWLENTHNRGGGRIFPQEKLEAIAQLARRRGLPAHLDGARLLHAAIATGRPVSDLAGPVDSTSICLSKGLGAPAGSVLAGSAAFIKRARRYRKMLGGGMRQIGILAAAGLYALENNVRRLVEDHHKAHELAGGLSVIKGITLDPAQSQTNIVIFELGPDAPTGERFLEICADQRLLFSLMGPRRVRAVTHMDVSLEACQEAVRIVQRVLA